LYSSVYLEKIKEQSKLRSLFYLLGCFGYFGVWTSKPFRVITRESLDLWAFSFTWRFVYFAVFRTRPFDIVKILGDPGTVNQKVLAPLANGNGTVKAGRKAGDNPAFIQN